MTTLSQACYAEAHEECDGYRAINWPPSRFVDCECSCHEDELIDVGFQGPFFEITKAQS